MNIEFGFLLKMIYLISSTRIYLRVHPHIREIRLNYFEKDWKVAQSFRDLSDFLAIEQSARANHEMGAPPKCSVFFSRNFFGLSRQPFIEKMARE